MAAAAGLINRVLDNAFIRYMKKTTASLSQSGWSLPARLCNDLHVTARRSLVFILCLALLISGVFDLHLHIPQGGLHEAVVNTHPSLDDAETRLPASVAMSGLDSGHLYAHQHNGDTDVSSPEQAVMHATALQPQFDWILLTLITACLLYSLTRTPRRILRPPAVFSREASFRSRFLPPPRAPPSPM